MITELNISNFATIDDLSINFKQGFTALTGETGAGKSILLDALGLLLGDRADINLIRHTAEQAEISVQLIVANNLPIIQHLQEQLIEFEQEIIIRRIIRRDGRSKAYINGISTSVSELNKIGNYLVDIQGQHSQQLLFKTHYQRQMLDKFSELEPQAKQLATFYADWHQAEKELTDIQQKQALNLQKLDLLNYQLQDFKKVAPQINEFETTMHKFEKLNSHAERLQLAHNANTILCMAEEDSVIAKLKIVENLLLDLTKLDSSTQPSLEQLQSAMLEINDIANQCQMLSTQDDLDISKLQYYEQRLSELNSLARLYNCDINQLHAQQHLIQQEIDSLAINQDNIAQLQTKIEQARTAYYQLAQQISTVRNQSQTILSQQVIELLPDLGMPYAEFTIKIHPLDKPSAYGMEKVEFLVTTNPGIPAAALNKVASGGELSRISLAIQVCLEKNLATPTIIFDEVDVGIGGSMAEIVGNKMRQLGEWMQVLCVTHQGQAAAKAHHQLCVSKHQTEHTTTTIVHELADQERVQEIARMIGGQTITTATLTHATELLQLNNQ